MNFRLNNTEILDAIDLLTTSKGFSRESTISLVEDAVKEIMHEKYGQESDIHVKLHRQTGEMEVFRVVEVVERPTDINAQISIIDAIRITKDAKIGVSIQQPLPDISSDRQIASMIKAKILKQIRSLEKQAEYNEFAGREGKIVSGSVKRATKNNCIVAIGKAEGIILRDGIIFGESFEEKSKVTACIEAVRRSDNDFQIILSRTSDNFLKEMLKEEIPELREGSVEVRSIARNPGSRAKVAVWSSDNRIDAVGACIGPRGSRINSVVEQLNGEKIDVIHWNRDLEILAKNAMIPARNTKIEIEGDQLNPEKKVIRVVVPESELSLAIGKRGQNVRLASKILGCDVEIISEEARKKEVLEKFNFTTSRLMSVLDVDEIVAQLLVSEGLISVRQVANSTTEALVAISGFDESIASELQQRAAKHMKEIEDEYSKKSKEVDFDKEIEKMPFFEISDYMTLIENGITSLKMLADLSTDELIDIMGKYLMPRRNFAKIVMDARAIVYGI